ncbi:MAG: UDP-N-acetylmuramoyl-L-alanine--D-glutamate ligase [Lachnospiraceae bacterium]|nr:UDP-N-acetylmuramoyl-L-alanine--D-glutamate ligase [Lachnospiraceae bacterium]
MNQTILVAGGGVSGIGAAGMLLETGKSVILYDGNENLDQEALRAHFPGREMEIVLGALSDEVVSRIEACVISPGIPMKAPFVKKLKDAGVPVWSEIEAAFRHAKGRLAAITGTNGKTTTTALTGQILGNYYESSFVVGNIGTAYTKEALNTKENSVTVAEISSFQLESIDTFHPQVSAILNLTPDHLDRHGSMEEYIRVKELVVKNQTGGDVCVLNYEDQALRSFGDGLSIKVFWFSSKRRVPGGIYLEGSSIVSEISGKREVLVNVGELQILGIHNYENAMAASAVSYAMGVPLDVIRNTLREFKAVEHRIEFVVERNGVAYYNDSKGTNPDAAIQGIRAMVRPTVLIAGGYDKGSVYGQWLEACRGKMKALILLGATAEKIAKEANSLGFDQIFMASSMEEAMELAKKLAEPGDAVLLSPACASWGMFKNYEDRGKIFKELARKIEE